MGYGGAKSYGGPITFYFDHSEARKSFPIR